jgi:hypothetical protein
MFGVPPVYTPISIPATFQASSPMRSLMTKKVITEAMSTEITAVRKTLTTSLPCDFQLVILMEKKINGRAIGMTSVVM